MKKWKQQVKVRGEVFDVIEHTDKECERPRRDGLHLAPRSHGFVCLYQNGQYKRWCGCDYASKRIIEPPYHLYYKLPWQGAAVGTRSNPRYTVLRSDTEKVVGYCDTKKEAEKMCKNHLECTTELF